MKPEVLLFYQRREDWLKRIKKENNKIFRDKSRFLQRDYEIDSVITCLEKEGFVLHHLSWQEDIKQIVSKLKKNCRLIGWNITDGYDLYLGAHFPSTLEMLGIKSVMENSFVQCLSQNKNLLKDILASQGIRVPKSIIIKKNTKFSKNLIDFKGPYFLKPAKLDNSIGVSSNYNIEKNTVKAFKKALKLSNTYDTPFMIEEYVDGFDETTPYAFLGGVLHISTLREVYYTKIQSNNLKDLRDKKIVKIDGKQSTELKEVAKRIINILDLNRYGRFDFRRDKQGNLYFLEFNPGTSLTCLSFEEFLKENNLSLSKFMKKMILSNYN